MSRRLRSNFHKNATHLHSTQLEAVYKAERVSDGAVVAVKEISLRNIPQDQYITLCLPYELSRDLFHPNLLEYYEAYVTPGESCLLEMEWCEGGLFSDILEKCYGKQEFLEEPFIWEIIAQISSALLYLHDPNKEQGTIIHRAVRVSSVFIGEAYLKIGKMGHTRHASELTVFSTRPKYDMYLPPEATTRQAPTDRWDIWGLGCLIVELCTLGTVYSDAQTLLKNLSYAMRRYSDKLGVMVANCLSLNSTDRPSAVEIMKHREVRRALQRLNQLNDSNASTSDICDSGGQGRSKDKVVENVNKSASIVEDVNLEEIQENFENHTENSLNEGPASQVHSAILQSSENLTSNMVKQPVSYTTSQESIPTKGSIIHIKATQNQQKLHNGVIPDTLMDYLMDDNVSRVAASMHELDSCLKTALDIALFEARVGVLQLLCKTIYERGINIQVSKQKGVPANCKSALLSAVEAGNVELVLQYPDQMMRMVYTSIPPHSSGNTKKAQDTNSNKKHEVTALMLAAAANNVELVKVLLPELGVKNGKGMTALMFAAQHDSVDVLSYLIPEAGMQTPEGTTALMMAVYSNSVECVKVLKRWECGICDRSGQTAHDYIYLPDSHVPPYYQSVLAQLLDE